MATDLESHRGHALELLARCSDGECPQTVIASLNSGLTQLRSLLVRRLHNDVEAYFGVDSMVAPR